MENIDWDKAPDGYPLWLEYLQKAIDSDESRRESGGCWVSDRGDRYVTMLDTFWSKPEEGFYRIHDCPSPPWSGEGLPPVGVVCEWREKTGFQWVSAEVLFISKSSVVMRRSDGFEWQMMTARTVFRSIRTPEQIAADEREAAIEQIMSAYEYKEGTCTHKLMRDQAARFYDAGLYRKP